MAVDLTNVFAGHFAGNLGPVPDDPDVRRAPDYSLSAGLDGGVVELVLTFRAGAAYCCYELGCHLSVDEDWWEWLRCELAARRVEAPPQLELHVTVVVEAGALFFDSRRPDGSRRFWYDFTPAGPCRHSHVFFEG
ncbi:MAG: hypothetical protein ACYC61_26335 [Isosphaeraceae bacterium]